jgi:uncharacterized membrane protein (DUF485 family)
VSLTQPRREGTSSYEIVEASPQFRAVRRRLAGFVVPVTIGFLAWYLGFVLLSAFAPDLMATPVLGDVNLGLCLGILQFATTLALTTWYAGWARGSMDPMVDQLREDLERGGR